MIRTVRDLKIALDGYDEDALVRVSGSNTLPLNGTVNGVHEVSDGLLVPVVWLGVDATVGVEAQVMA